MSKFSNILTSLFTALKREPIKQLFVFTCYLSITLAIFWSRLQVFSTSYGLSGIDTDATLWYYWARTHALYKGAFFAFNNSLIGFPYGFDMSSIPYKNILYDSIVLLNTYFGHDGGWRVIIMLSNFFSLFTYPLTAYFTYRMMLSISKNSYVSFVGGVIFGFSSYFLIYSGGALALNQLWLVPLYFWTLIVTIEREFKVRYIILSAFILAITFGITPYWGGYSIFFSPVILVAVGKMGLKRRLKGLVILFVIFLLVFICINGDLLISNFSFLSSNYAQSKGFVSDHFGQMIRHVYEHFIPQNRSLLHSASANNSYFYLGTISIALYFLYLLKDRKNQIANIFNVCLLISIFVSTYISSLYAVSELTYTFYLRLFRAVSRIHLYSVLFIGVVATISLKSLLQKYSRKVQLVLCLLLSLVILLENYDTHHNWLVATDMTKFERLYSDVKNDKDTKLVISYPLVATKEYPIPSNSQYIAQIHHGKTMVNGFNINNKQHMALLSELSELTPKVINKWQELGVDTVILYAKEIPGIDKKIALLLKDNRVKFIKKNTETVDSHPMNHKLDSVVDIRLLKISPKLSNAYSRIAKTPLLSIDGDSKKLSSSIFQLHFNKIGTQTVQLNYPFHPDWRILSINKSIWADFRKLGDIRQISSISVNNGEANNWTFSNQPASNYYILWLPDLYTLPFVYLKLITISILGVYFIFLVSKKTIRAIRGSI